VTPVQRDDMGGGTGGEALNTGGAGSKVNTPVKTNFSPALSGPFKDAYNAVSGMAEAGSEKPDAPKVTSQGDPVTSVTIDVPITVTLPQWTPPASECDNTKNTWNKFITPLTAHEQHHVDIDKKIFGALPQKIVGKADKDVDDIANAAVDQSDKEQAAYDTTSDHGKNEGVAISYASCGLEKVPPG